MQVAQGGADGVAAGAGRHAEQGHVHVRRGERQPRRAGAVQLHGGLRPSSADHRAEGGQNGHDLRVRRLSGEDAGLGEGEDLIVQLGEARAGRRRHRRRGGAEGRVAQRGWERRAGRGRRRLLDRLVERRCGLALRERQHARRQHLHALPGGRGLGVPGVHGGRGHRRGQRLPWRRLSRPAADRMAPGEAGQLGALAAAAGLAPTVGARRGLG
mmetsp:Transcript_12477/g.40929  ORF Transcript_12477/g.40929 Transcript_12477/m.40929 type:complete len:213 (+) Transcript_12477:607-1245(+)